MTDLLIIGGGVMGLSLAYETARQGGRVRLIERGEPGREASWAGAGILPPAPNRADASPYDRLCRLSYELHAVWAARLREETSIDNGYRRSGALYVARDGIGEDELRTSALVWRRQGIVAEELSGDDVARLEPALAGGVCRGRIACLLPDEAQIRNPRHLRALAAACISRGIDIRGGCAADDFELQAGRVRAVRAGSERFQADRVCITGGPWSRLLLARLGVQVPMKPVRGQIVLLETAGRALGRIVNEGRRYLVPRGDGRVLVGSTEEDAGFDKRTTAAGIGGLVGFVLEVAPSLADAQVAQCWAGLRPGSQDGLPYLGAVPGFDNLFVAAGHFRSGLYLSTGTAVVMSQLIGGEKPAIDLGPFALDRD